MQTVTEQKLSDALDEWALKGPGIVLVQKNPVLLVNILREAGFEIVPAGEVQRLRYDLKNLNNEVLQMYRMISAAKTRLEQLNQKEIMQEVTKEQPVESEKPVTKVKKPQV